MKVRVKSTGGLRGLKEPDHNHGICERKILKAYLEYEGHTERLVDDLETDDATAARLIGKTGELIGMYTKPNEWPPDRLTVVVVIDNALYLLKRDDIEFAEKTGGDSTT